jgi:hypothetical protein
MQDDQFTSKSPFADVADSRERSNFSHAGRPSGGPRRTTPPIQLCVNPVHSSAVSRNVGDVLVAVH